MMLHACSALRLFIYCLYVQRFQTMTPYTRRTYGAKMGDGSAQFLWIFAICRKTELSDNENEVNRPHLASASGTEGERCASCRTPSSDPHSNRKLLPTKHSALHTANNETQHIAHCTHAHTRMGKKWTTKKKKSDDKECRLEYDIQHLDAVNQSVIALCRFPIDFIALYCNFSALHFRLLCRWRFFRIAFCIT